MHLLFVRHGETEMNVLNKERPILNGQAHTPLTVRGLEQAIDAGRKIAAMTNIRLKHAISSTIERSVITARKALEQLPYAVSLELTDALRERSLGVFEGKFADDVYAEFPEYRDDPNLKYFREHFVQKAPGGENLAEVTARAWEALQQFEEACDGDLAIFSHGTTMRCLLGKALELSEQQIIEISVPNAAPILLEKSGGGYRVVSGLDL